MSESQLSRCSGHGHRHTGRIALINGVGGFKRWLHDTRGDEQARRNEVQDGWSGDEGLAPCKWTVWPGLAGSHPLGLAEGGCRARFPKALADGHATAEPRLDGHGHVPALCCLVLS